LAIKNSDVVDAVIHDAESDSVSIVAIQAGESYEAEQYIDLLRDKLSTYLFFFDSKQFEELYPEYCHKKVNIQLEFSNSPPAEVNCFLDQLKIDLENNYGMSLIINIHDDKS
jgi:hypothetical protein